MQRETAKAAAEKSANKFAAKRIEKDGLPKYQCVTDALVSDFLAGVAWQRRQGRKKAKHK